MDTCFIFEQVQRMRPSSFSEEERHRYQAEKMMLRQFMLMKQQDQVPDHLSVRNMKTWLLTGRSFLEEFQEAVATTGAHLLFMTELAWTTARVFCLNQMEQELLEELDKEKQLSQLFNRKVTLEGLQMLVSVVRPGAEEDVQTFLPSLKSRLLKILGGHEITTGPLCTGDIQPTQLLELERSTAALVPEVVDIALTFSLEEPDWENKNKAAIAEIGKLLANSAAPFLSPFGSISETVLHGVCAIIAQFMVNAIYKRVVNRSKSFHQMDYDESFFSAREGVISAIQDMNYSVETAESSQAHLHLSCSEGMEDGLLEEREASPEFVSSEHLELELVEKREASLHVAATLNHQDELLEKREASSEFVSSEHLELELVEKREASLHVAATLKHQDELLEKREASSEFVSSEHLELELVEKREASLHVAATLKQQDGLLEEREASPEFVSSEHLKLQLVENREASLHVAATLKQQDGFLEKREASSEFVSSEHLELELVEKREASLHVAAKLKQQDGLLEEREASPEFVSSEHLKLELVEKREASLHVAATLKQQDGLLEKREASSEFVSSEHLELELVEKREASLHVAATLKQQDGLLEKREASSEFVSSEHLELELVEKREASLHVAATLKQQDELLEKREASSEIVSSEHLELELVEKREASLHVAAKQELQEQLLEKREASPRVSVDEEVTKVTKVTSLARLETNLIVYMDDELEVPQQEVVEESEHDETLVQGSAVQYIYHKVQTAVAPQGHAELRSSEEPQEQLQEKREASPELSLHKNTTSLVRLETNVIVYMEDELEVLQQEEVEESDTEESLVQDCVVKKKKGVRAFFRGLWKMMTCCVRASTED